jgi:hypothetical protein
MSRAVLSFARPSDSGRRAPINDCYEAQCATTAVGRKPTPSAQNQVKSATTFLATAREAIMGEIEQIADCVFEFGALLCIDAMIRRIGIN